MYICRYVYVYMCNMNTEQGDSTFTRVAITFDDDDDDEAEENEEGTMAEVSGEEGEFTRLVITDDDEDEVMEDIAADNDSREAEGTRMKIDEAELNDDNDKFEATWKDVVTPIKSNAPPTPVKDIEVQVENRVPINPAFTRVAIIDDDEEVEQKEGKTNEHESIPIKQSEQSNNNLSKEKEDDRLKELGNEAMKALDYQGAVDFYSKSLEVNPANLLTRNNRVQAYLKLNEFVKAELDATYVLEKDQSCFYSGAATGLLSKGTATIVVTPTAKKALFRRAMVSVF
jgi:tetratricopeptide (TPR) repeat protein